MAIATAPMQKYMNSNTSVLSKLEPGDLIEFKRGIYAHWAVYIGEGDVIHMAGVDNGPLQSGSGHIFTICGLQFNKAIVKVDNFWDVAGDCKAIKNNSKDQEWDALKREEIVKNATSMLGPVSYNLLFQNCEHFANWCRYGKKHSDQATVAKGVIATGSVFGIIGLGALFTYLGGLLGRLFSFGPKQKQQKKEPLD